MGGLAPTVYRGDQHGEVRTVRSTGSRRFLTAPALPHAVAFAFGREHRRVMGQAIEQSGRELLIARKHGDPFGKREI